MGKYLIFGFSISFISWIVAIIANSILMKTKYYGRFSNLNVITDSRLNQYLGLKYFKWIVKNTPFRFFNPNLKLESKAEIADLIALRKQMTIAEVSHLIGFGFVAIFAIIALVKLKPLLALCIMFANTLMNLYPSLLQQENKRRIDRFIKIFGKRSGK